MSAQITPPTASDPGLFDRAGTPRQLLRFGIVGVGINIVLFAAYLGLVDWGADPKHAMTLTYAGGLSLGFVLHRRWTYASNGPARGQWVPYVVVSALGYGLNLVVLGLCVDRWRWPHAWVQGTMVLVIAASTFALNKVWVFRARAHR